MLLSSLHEALGQECVCDRQSQQLPWGGIVANRWYSGSAMKTRRQHCSIAMIDRPVPRCHRVVVGLKNSSRHGPLSGKNHQGVYTLIIRSMRPHRIKVGERLSIVLERSTYLYTGSALGRGSTSLEWRLGRHMSRKKRQFWHVDRILSCGSTRLVSVVLARTGSRVECRVNTVLLGIPDVRSSTKRVGSSDCKCQSHLLAAKCGPYAVQLRVASCYASLGLDPFVLKSPRTYGSSVHSNRAAGVGNYCNAVSNALNRS